jgi:trimeric autotransporter adhesin
MDYGCCPGMIKPILMKRSIYKSYRGWGMVLILILLTFTRQGVAQIELVKDINPYVQFYNEYGSMVEVNGTLYFAADQSLWKTDGSSQGSLKIKTFRWIGQMISFRGMLVFSADDGKTGRELWKCDGTERGTVLLKDIMPGEEGSDPSTFTVVDNLLFFIAYTEQTGMEIWRTDGTKQGTALVDDLMPGPESSQPNNLVSYNGQLLFVADDGMHGAELHIATLTRQHPTDVFDILPGSEGSVPANLTVSGEFLYFSAQMPALGNELWKTDGTFSGTVMVSDIWPGVMSSYPSLMIDVAGTLFFVADDGVNGSEYWRSNGNTTALAFELYPGPDASFGDYPYDEDYGFHCFDEATANGKLYFVYQNELYESDGTSAGTRSLGLINDGCVYYTQQLYSVLGTIYLFAMDQGNCCNYGHIWHLAKVENGALVTVTPLPQTENMNLQIVATSLGLFFPFCDDQRNFRLWISDGTDEGTYPIHDAQVSTMSSTPRDMVRVGDYITFYADDHIEYVVTRQWRSDGTLEGTYRIDDFPLLNALASSNNKLTGTESALWIKNISTMLRLRADSSNIQLLENYKGSMYFTIADPVRTYVELWRSDGTRAGTVRIKVLTRDVGYGARDGAVFNNILYFAGTPENIWRTDGTSKGTFLVGYSGANAVTGADEFIATETTLFFRAYYPGIGVELFKLDAEDAPIVASAVKTASLGNEVSIDSDVQLRCYPNPFSNAFTFTLWTNEDQPMKASLRAMDGRMVAQMDGLFTNQTYAIGQEAGRGIYLLCVQVGSRVLVEKVVKW